MADNKHPPKPELNDKIISDAVFQMRRIGMLSYAIRFVLKCTKHNVGEDILLGERENEVFCDCLRTSGLMSEMCRKWYPYSGVFQSLGVNPPQTENAVALESCSDHQNCSGEH